MCAPRTASATDDGDDKSALFSSTPLWERAWAAGLEGSLVIPRILNSLDKTGSTRICLMTEPPWLPVAPKTVMSLDMLCLELRGVRCRVLTGTDKNEQCLFIDAGNDLF